MSDLHLGGVLDCRWISDLVQAVRSCMEHSSNGYLCWTDWQNLVCQSVLRLHDKVIDCSCLIDKPYWNSGGVLRLLFSYPRAIVQCSAFYSCN